MNDNEVNKIIAEFMGGYTDKYDEEYVTVVKPYTISLDALVPVWEKLDTFNKTTFEGILLGYCWGDKDLHTSSFVDYAFGEMQHYHYYGSHNTIQQAAAHATAKAILELKEEE